MAKKKIMIVDDEPSFTRMVKMCLEKTGDYEVLEENDGARSVSAARVFQPDLILLDVIMPGCDGGDVVAQLRNDGPLARVPVIFLTATMTEEGMKTRGGTIGGFPVLCKPVDAKKLTKQIEKTLSATR
jgi:DNA-binding response OmpR family regulator